MRLITLLITLLALAGCALSPQTVTVDPALTVAPKAVADGQALDLRVVDARASEEIGTRGGVYRQSSQILAANDVADAVRMRAIEGLRVRGYSLGESTAAVQVRLSIEQLDYVVPPGTVATSADITAVLKASVDNSGKKYETTYRSTVNRKFPVPPTATQNAIWINEVLGDTLQRFLDDPRIHGAIAP